MIMIRHMRTEPDGQPIENTFRAIDSRTGDELGSAVLYTDLNPVLFPTRPLQVRLDLEGSDIPDRLIGASIARAHQICYEADEYARVFTRCAPNDYLTLKLFGPFGFEDNDGLVKMRADLPSALSPHIPEGCELAQDDLRDSLEKRSFLERYNRLFNTGHDMAWLEQYIDRSDFRRLMLLYSGGVAGEILIWREGTAGVIGFIQTSKGWRRRGVASCLIGAACDQMAEASQSHAECNIRARYPHMLRLLGKAGFEQTEVLMRYPGIDIDPT